MKHGEHGEHGEPREHGEHREHGEDGGDKVRLTLVGVGHAHMEVLRRLILTPRSDVDLTVVSLSTKHHYSGMVPGYLNGTYQEEEIAFDLPPLVAKAGGAFVEARAVGIDPRQRRVHLADSRSIPYDLVSFNIGSRTAGQDRPEVSQHATVVKPMSRAIELAGAIRTLAAKAAAASEGGSAASMPATSVPAAVVVGAGAAGFEVACAVAAVFAATGGPHRVTLLDAEPQILPGYSEVFRNRAEAILRRKGIEVRRGVAVEAVGADFVALAGGEHIRADLVIWLAGAAASPVFAGSGLPVDSRGFLLVDSSLRSPADPRVFAVGDCGTLVEHPRTPKAGVYAVRQGPVLWASLTAALDGGEPPHYEPQSSFLSILNTGDGKALLRYQGFTSHGRWAWWLKDWIDRRFMEKYRRLI